MAVYAPEQNPFGCAVLAGLFLIAVVFGVIRALFLFTSR